MYVSGDFVEASSNNYGFSASGEHKVVLDGTEAQSATFNKASSHFATLEITKPMDNYTFNPNPCWITLIAPEEIEFGEPDLVLPGALAEIDESAFEGVIAGVVLVSDACTIIGEYAFRDAAVTQIRIPENCSIADTAFEGCDAVQIFGTPGSEAEAFCETHDNCTFFAE